MLNLSAELRPGVFSPSYQVARHLFTDTYRQLPGGLQQGLQEFKHPLSGPGEEPLACDVAFLGRQTSPEALLVMVSGTHGVEGFAGSAIQVDCLPLLAPLLSANPSLGLVLIHAFNPWGFAWLRRYDHEGIDLNRNFIDFEKPVPPNKDYDRLHEKLAIGLDGGDLSSLWRDMGLEQFAEVVSRGQYTHADGFFYGGTAPSWSRRQLERLSEHAWFVHAKKIAVLDLHTGLGPYGYGELINDHEPGSAGDRFVANWYGENACSAQRGESVSTMKHGLLDFFWHELIGDRGCFATLEYGTYPLQELVSTLVQEQRYFASTKSQNEPRDLAQPDVVALRKFFYPEELSWQQQVLFRGRQVVSLAVQGLLNG